MELLLFWVVLIIVGVLANHFGADTRHLSGRNWW